MENIKKLIDIANSVNRNDLESDLRAIQTRLDAKSKDIVIPLVGEFSAGKTSIIISPKNQTTS